MVTKVWKTDDGLYFYSEEEATNHEYYLIKKEELIQKIVYKGNRLTEEAKYFNKGVREALETAFELGYLNFK